ncbi:hypothetical protein FACS189493_0850 [Spirochaetia bacterium]|nr:hypothetical protein FACS189493_0850 [Spirochaetia bacterium]
MIAVDIECYDPNLHSMGSGEIRGDSNNLCVGIYDGTNYSCYTVPDDTLRERLASNEPKIAQSNKAIALL